MLCQTKTRTGQLKGQCCTRRSVCYEIWCMDCKEKEEKIIEEMDIEDAEKLALKKKINKNL